MRSDIATMKADLVQEVKDTLLKEGTYNIEDSGNRNCKIHVDTQSSITSVATGNISAETIVKKVTNEMQARLAHKDNIAFYNVQEPTGTLKADLVRQDKQSVVDICDELEVNIYEEDILYLKRVGKKHQKRKVHGEEVEVPRILIVTFKESTKLKIMKNAYRLTNSDSDF